MFYTIYKTTNNINGKFYIGKHQTNNLNDEYMGSGKRIKKAIKKYGIENFTKEILFIFESEEEMNLKEKELVTEEFVKREDTYNLCPGGHGGFGYINSNIMTDDLRKAISLLGLLSPNNYGSTGYKHTKESRDKISNYLKNNKHFENKSHTKETRQLMSNIHKERGNHIGEKNSQYGTCWITNGIINKKVKNDMIIELGWNKGRCFNKQPLK